MIVSAYQPFFAPFSGFFEKALRSDVMVLMDDVQFPRGTTWITRNRFKNDQGVLWLTVPVWKKGLGLQKILDVRICHEGRWVEKHLSSLESAYAKSPFFYDYFPFVEEIYRASYERLVDFNTAIIKFLFARLNIDARCLLLSDLGIKDREPELSIMLCKRLSATWFLAQRSAEKFLDKGLFDSAGVKLSFFRPSVPVYPQLWGQFIPNLSVLDLLFNCGPRASSYIGKQAGKKIERL